ncbi:MAG: thioredoxin-dependent thiol peroxidase [Alphaproteobacteria bacterium]|nr:thioredoxin-dependent thiol peroxidase [Alphaproteobacteria bacterium]
MLIQEGTKAPDFELLDDQNKMVRVSDFKGKKLVLYFYPKDDTPGCAAEACDFRDNFKALDRLNVSVVGISNDSVESHVQFKNKYELNFPLLSDESKEISNLYEVYKEQKFNDTVFIGIERSTFLIDEEGVLRKIWRGVRVRGHAEDILNSIQELSK